MAEPSGPGLLAPPKSLPGGSSAPPIRKPVIAEERQAKGTIPQFGQFGDNNVGYTGVFAVKKQQRRQGDDDLFPEPQPMGTFDQKPEATPAAPADAAQQHCCLIL
ncbi:unnamed protein product [Closterium sp. Naga37s-1]|nr:unnamed protein product [Closterium sp. Naga37s-1]